MVLSTMAPRLLRLASATRSSRPVTPSADGSRLIRATIPRDSVFLAQTPQAFRRDVLARALSEGKDVDATDEAMLVERLGLPVHVVDGDAKKHQNHDAGGSD